MTDYLELLLVRLHLLRHRLRRALAAFCPPLAV